MWHGIKKVKFEPSGFYCPYIAYVHDGFVNVHKRGQALQRAVFVCVTEFISSLNQPHFPFSGCYIVVALSPTNRMAPTQVESTKYRSFACVVH